MDYRKESELKKKSTFKETNKIGVMSIDCGIPTKI